MQYPTMQAGGSAGDGGGVYLILPEISCLHCETSGRACTCDHGGCTGCPEFECGGPQNVLSGRFGLECSNPSDRKIRCFFGAAVLVMICFIAWVYTPGKA
jgi:hypothetical protein